ncbi:DUF4189 domain-containing protein [Pseudomonas syringae]|uniref:DUF4189 domain-containing protein n=1 Tax=Pseudomonas syringae TaxID=317 RepID=UPI0009AF5430|nr:DUF4189 domain-containing protein [Pseudomonas syringae]
MKFLWTLVVFLPCFVESVQAEQGCPPGQYQIGGQGAVACAPIPQENSGQQQPVAPRPTGEWIETWGAIAMGSIDATTSFGVTTGKLSKSEAEEDSLRRCASHGEDNCKVLISYHNQCVALAEPQINGMPFSTGVISASRAGTIAEASEMSAKDCKEKNKQTPSAQCKVGYSACTEQIFHKY